MEERTQRSIDLDPRDDGTGKDGTCGTNIGKGGSEGAHREREGESVDCIGLLAEKTWRSGTVFCDAVRLSQPGPRKNGMKCIGRKLAPPQPPTLICMYRH